MRNPLIPIPTSTSPFGDLPLLQSGSDLYEAIMGSIEPDLLLSNMPQVILEMQHDTDERKAERAERYSKAFAEYDRRLTEHKKSWDAAYNAYRHSSMESLTRFLQAADTEHMTDIEKQLDDSTPTA